MVEYTSQYPPSHNSTYVKSTYLLAASYYQYFATDPSKSLTGSQISNGFVSSSATNTRFHIDLGEAKTIKRIYYENYHESGATYNRGANAVTFWGSNEADAFSNVTYATDTDWTQLTLDVTNFVKHAESNTADPQYALVTNSTAYRYYALKIASTFSGGDYIGLRRIELQTESGWSNIAKVNTVASGDIAKINTISNSDIAKINGILV